MLLKNVLVLCSLNGCIIMNMALSSLICSDLRYCSLVNALMNIYLKLLVLWHCYLEVFNEFTKAPRFEVMYRGVVFSCLFWLLPAINLPPWYSWNIVESGIKHHNPYWASLEKSDDFYDVFIKILNCIVAIKHYP